MSLRNLTAIMLFGIGLAGCGKEAPPKGPATDEAVSAIALPESQLRTFLMRSTLGTHSGPMFLYDLGLERGCVTLETAVDAAVQAHLPAWRQNLISAYRENVPEAELARAAQRSPHSANRQLGEYRDEIGRAMQAKSSELLNRAGVEVLSAMSAEAAKIDSSKVDRAAREKELRAAMNEKNICREQLELAESVDA